MIYHISRFDFTVKPILLAYKEKHELKPHNSTAIALASVGGTALAQKHHLRLMQLLQTNLSLFQTRRCKTRRRTFWSLAWCQRLLLPLLSQNSKAITSANKAVIETAGWALWGLWSLLKSLQMLQKKISRLQKQQDANAR